MSHRSGPPQAATSLDVTTKLARLDRGEWLVWLYPDAAEAAGTFRPSGVGSARAPGEVEDPGRAAVEAARRARGRVRRYCAANRLNRLATLTYAGTGCHDPLQLRADVADFFRRLRQRHAQAFPYLWTAEWHSRGHGLHVHFAAGRYIRRSWIDEAWGRGMVDIRLLGDVPSGAGALGEARLAARYLAKYVSKAPAAGSGLHRYEVAQGFQPRREAIRAATAREALAIASARLGGEPSWVFWSLRDATEWHGPPAVCASWDV